MAVPPRLASDVEALRADGCQIDIIEEGQRCYVILHDFKLPDSKYSPVVVDIMVMADLHYPVSAMDMFWTTPGVIRIGGGSPQNAELIEQYAGRKWQRWSWHYQGWDPSRHSIRTHLEVVKDRLARGV